MSARDEILHLMHRYCTTIDTGDFKAPADLFEHASWTVEGSEPRVGSRGRLAFQETTDPPSPRG